MYNPDGSVMYSLGGLSRETELENLIGAMIDMESNGFVVASGANSDDEMALVTEWFDMARQALDLTEPSVDSDD